MTPEQQKRRIELANNIIKAAYAIAYLFDKNRHMVTRLKRKAV